MQLHRVNRHLSNAAIDTLEDWNMRNQSSYRSFVAAALFALVVAPLLGASLQLSAFDNRAHAAWLDKLTSASVLLAADGNR